MGPATDTHQVPTHRLKLYARASCPRREKTFLGCDKARLSNTREGFAIRHRRQGGKGGESRISGKGVRK